MKKFNPIILFFLFQLTVFSGFSQKEIPNYIFAENAKPVIVLVSNIYFNKNVQTHWKGGKEYVKVSEYQNLNEAVWAEVVRVVANSFEDMGMKPSAVIGLDMAELITDRDLYNRTVKEKFSEIKPYYVIAVGFSDKKGLRNKFNRQKRLFPKDIKNASLSIGSFLETDPKVSYQIAIMFASFEKVLNKLQEDVNVKPPNYFLKNISEDKIAENEKKVIETIVNLDKLKTLETVSREYPKFPQGITNKKLLVVHLFQTNSHNESMNNRNLKAIEALRANLDKRYKGEYKLVFFNDYPKEISGGEYDYVLVPFHEAKVKTTISTSTDHYTRARQNETELINVFHYVVKDIETKEAYYGPNKKKLMNYASQNLNASLTVTLNSMAKYYGWK
ncbi:hypothetical protein ACFLRZ_03990 [Bacteroidota bacterium]